MADVKALGSKFLSELLEHVDPAQRDAVKAALTSDAVIEAAGTREAQLDTWHGQLATWKTEAEAELEKRTKAAPALQTGATPLFTLDDVKKEASKIADAAVAREMEGAAAYIDVVTTLGIDHFKEFGERLDIAALRRDPEVAKVGLMGVYEKVHGPKVRERREAAAAAAATAREAEIRADERRKVEKERPGPYPVGGVREPSPLDAITNPDKDGKRPSVPSVDDLNDEYQAEVARLQRAGTVGAAQ